MYVLDVIKDSLRQPLASQASAHQHDSTLGWGLFVCAVNKVSKTGKWVYQSSWNINEPELSAVSLPVILVASLIKHLCSLPTESLDVYPLALIVSALATIVRLTCRAFSYLLSQC